MEIQSKTNLQLLKLLDENLSENKKEENLNNNSVKEFLNNFYITTNNINDKIQAREIYKKYIENSYKHIDEKQFSKEMLNNNNMTRKKFSKGNYYIYLKEKKKLTNSDILYNYKNILQNPDIVDKINDIFDNLEF